MRSLLLCIALVVPAIAVAQRRAPAPYERAPGAYAIDIADGEPISFFLEISRELRLTDVQRKRLMDIRRRLRVQNAPHLAQIDSLRRLAGLDLGAEGGIKRSDVEAARRVNEWAKPVIDSMRLNNDLARAEARTVLDVDQRTRLDSIVREDRAQQRVARRGRAREARQ